MRRCKNLGSLKVLPELYIWLSKGSACPKHRTPHLVTVLISPQSALLVSDHSKLGLNLCRTGWWAMLFVLHSQINGMWQSPEVDPHCMWTTHFWQNALNICQVAYLQHSARCLSTLSLPSLPACAEAKAQPGISTQGLHMTLLRRKDTAWGMCSTHVCGLLDSQ